MNSEDINKIEDIEQLFSYFQFHPEDSSMGQVIKARIGVLQSRKDHEHRTHQKSRLDNLETKLVEIEGHVSRVPEQKPEWKSWTFWFSLVAIAISLLALFRDVLGWELKSHAPSTTETNPKRSAPETQLVHPSLAPPATTKGAALGEGSTPKESPQEAKTSPCESLLENTD